MSDFFQTILMYLLYIIIFTIIYTFVWGLVRNYFRRFLIYYQIGIGAVMAVLAILAVSLIPNFMPSIGVRTCLIYLPLLICWLIGIFISWYSTLLYVVAIFIFIFAIAPNLASNSNAMLLVDTTDIVIVVVLYLVAVLTSVIHYYLKWTRWMTWLIVSLISFIFVTLMIVINSRQLTLNSGVQQELMVLIWIIMSYLVYALNGIVEVIYNHAIKLQNIVEYDRTTYIREALAHEAIYNYIHTNNIRHGIYFTYVINNVEKLEKIMQGTIKNKVIDLVSQQVFKAWKDRDVIFFKASLNHFGIFLPLSPENKVIVADLISRNDQYNRTKQDCLAQFNDLLGEIILTFVLQNYQIKIKLQGFASIYGLQSNNLEKLSEYNIIMDNIRKQVTYNNSVICSDIEAINKFRLQKRNILALNEKIALDRIRTFFANVVDVETEEFQSPFYYAFNMWEGDYLESSLDEGSGRKAKKTNDLILVRYAAALNIKNFQKLNTYLTKKIFILYSGALVGNVEFDLKKFVNKLVELKIRPENLILTFNLQENEFDSETLTINLDQLRKIGVQIAVDNFGARDADMVNLAYYKPNYAILAPDIIRNFFIHLHQQELLAELQKISAKLDIELIAPQINNFLIYNKIKSLGIRYMFGTLFGSHETPQVKLSDDIQFLLLKYNRKEVHNEIET